MIIQSKTVILYQKFLSNNPFFSYVMAKGIFIISLFAVLFGTGKLFAQEWCFFEENEGVCSVDSLVVVNPQYYSLFDTIEHHWSMCEISEFPCYAVIEFIDNSHLKVCVNQTIAVFPLVISCYMNKIYGMTCYGKLQYFFKAPSEYMIDKEAFQKTTSKFTPSYFSAQTYRDQIAKNAFITKKIDRKMPFAIPSFDFEDNIEEVYDKLRLEILFLENDIICNKLESCIQVNSTINPTH